MNSNWKEYELGQIVDMRTNKVSASHITINNYISTENMLSDKGGITISSGLPMQNNYLEFRKGDVLFSNIRTYFKKIWQASFDGGASNDIIVFRSKNKQILDQSFLYYIISNDNFIDFTIATAKGTKMPRGDRDAMKRFKFRIPVDINEQRSIANILNGLEQKVVNNISINQTLESIAQTFFKSWFVDFDPVKSKIEARENGKEPTSAAMQILSGKTVEDTQNFAGAEYNELKAIAAIFPDELENSEIGWIPKGWSLTSLYETAEYVNGGAFRNGDFSPDKEGLPIIKIAELKSGISSQTQYTTNDVLQKYHIDNGDMLYSWSGSPETSLDVFKWFGGEGWLNQHIFKINTKTKVQKVFVYFLLQYLKPQLIEIAKNKQTTGLGHVTIADMKRINVLMPSKKDLKLLMGVLIPLFDKSSNCMQQNMVLAEQRNVLLPRLLSGEITLNEIIES